MHNGKASLKDYCNHVAITFLLNSHQCTTSNTQPDSLFIVLNCIQIFHRLKNQLVQTHATTPRAHRTDLTRHCRPHCPTHLRALRGLELSHRHTYTSTASTSTAAIITQHPATTNYVATLHFIPEVPSSGRSSVSFVTEQRYFWVETHVGGRVRYLMKWPWPIWNHFHSIYLHEGSLCVTYNYSYYYYYYSLFFLIIIIINSYYYSYSSYYYYSYSPYS
jgi:hypothetical protein